MEGKIKEALGKLEGDLAGSYKSLNEMSNEEKQGLIDEHLLFNDADDNCLRSAGGYDDWPVSSLMNTLKALNSVLIKIPLFLNALEWQRYLHEQGEELYCLGQRGRSHQNHQHAKGRQLEGSLGSFGRGYRRHGEGVEIRLPR